MKRPKKTWLVALVFALWMAPAFAEEPPAEDPEKEQTVDSAAEEPGEHGSEHETHDPTKEFNFTNFHWSGKDAHGGKYGDGVMTDHEGKVVLDEHGKPAEEEPMSAPYVLMVLNFAILLGLLAWKGGPAMRKIAVERHEQIKTALDEAAKLRDQAAKKLAEYETRLKDADSEIKKMVDGMRADAESDKKRILAAAEAQATQMKKDAETRIAAELEYARARLTREVTDAAITAAERILRTKETADDEANLVNSFISDLQQATPPGGAS